MKKALALLLGLAMAASLAGCGGSAAESPAPAEDAAEEEASGSEEGGELSGEITFVAWGSDAELKCDEKVCEAFEASHPGTTVNFEALNDDYATTVETRILGGQSPDVIYGHPLTLLNWIQQGLLLPITDVYESHDDLWDEEVFFTNLYESYHYGDDYYATPVGADTSVLFYNKDLFDAAGLDYPTADTTWDELADMAQKLTQRDADGVPTVVGLDGLTGNWQNILYSMGGKVVDDMNNPTKVVFDSPEALQMLNWINDNYNEENGFYATESDWSYLGGGFANGEVAMFISGVYDIVWLSETEGLNWDIAPIPETMKDEGDTPILYCGYAVSAKSDNPELAKEFAYFMTSKEAQEIMGETGLITSLRKDVAYSDEMLKFDGAPEHNALRVDTIPYGQNQQGQCLCWWEITTAVDNEIYKMVHGEETPEEAMAAIQQQASDLLDAELANS